ncbi:MAG: hypothetical protein CMC76_07365 [Flavobacteriaceae bacterium]|nr:hypothetical protein [Flavobacteriaceae bacterium]
MKRLVLILCLTVVVSCSKSDNTYNCNFLFDVNINLTVNTNLPQFNQLNFTGSSVYVAGYGNGGIWLHRLNSNTLYAWDASDPNHEPVSCSTLGSLDGEVVTCGCEDENRYSLSTGYEYAEEITQPCTLKPYRVEDIGNNTFLVTGN